ncbi:predicted protein [Nematostella vectensis]|uniref:Sec20 C-terminal domain-containing protein n=1 Tax=Nematostella vectensis TaxID=45351 RepID=A7RZJ5_NEMVE|nr:vesicle transport protein SEC20 [Nematostella vectensis]EDO43106.1 predicted protein [Nematostella vectensis]|eukprot:XP_001635169.1 predicted protein [Nematostella vectensis]
MEANETLDVPIQAKIQVRDIVKLEFEIQSIVQEIRGCDGPLKVLDELNSRAKRTIKSLKGKIQHLEQLAHEQDKETDKNAILVITEQHHKELASMQTSIRKANLACKEVIDRGEKEALFGNSSSDIRKRNFNKESLAETTGNITKDLMSIARMMESQVRHAEEDVQILASSSATVHSTQEEYKGLSGVINASKNLLNKYNRREVTDRLLIFCGVVLFVVTVLYVVKKRLPSVW